MRRTTFALLAVVSLAAACESVAAVDRRVAPVSSPAPREFSLVRIGTPYERAREINGPPTRIEQKGDTTVWIYDRGQSCGRASTGSVSFVRGASVTSQTNVFLGVNCPPSTPP